MNVGDLGELDGRIIIAESYAEAAGFIVAHKAGNIRMYVCRLVYFCRSFD